MKTYRHLTSSPSLLQTSKHLCVFNPNGDLSWVIKNCYWGEAEETQRKHPKNPSGWDGAIRILAPSPNTSLFDMHSLPSPNLNFKNQSEKRPEFLFPCCPRKIPDALEGQYVLRRGSVRTFCRACPHSKCIQRAFYHLQAVINITFLNPPSRKEGVAPAFFENAR